MTAEIQGSTEALACTGHHGNLGDSAADTTSCQAIRETFSWVGDKWTLLVVRSLIDGPLRFGELKVSVEGISQRMLTLTLRRLERDGLVSRTVYPEIPPHVEYELTELGRTLIEPVAALSIWAVEQYPRLHANRLAFDADRQRSQG